LNKFIVKVNDKNQVKCPNCGYLINAPPREISLNKLKHMNEVKELTHLHGSKDTTKLTNVRALICPECGGPVIVLDRFSNRK